MPTSLIAAAVLVLIAGCSRGAQDTARVPAATGPQNPLNRELAIPKLEPRESCPRTRGKDISPDFAPGLGAGPAYPVGLGRNGVLDELEPPERFESDEWAGQKVLWVVEPSYDGPVLIRGRQLDGPHEVRFDEGDVPPKQIWMPAEDAPDERWRERPSYTRVRGSGCYGYQVDGPNFSLVIVFEVRPVSE